MLIEPSRLHSHSTQSPVMQAKVDLAAKMLSEEEAMENVEPLVEPVRITT